MYPPVAVEGALAKISRVLPVSTRERLQALASQLMIFRDNQETRPDVGLLPGLSEAIQLSQPLSLAYKSGHNQLTKCQVEPYAISGWRGHWYLVGYCRLRQDFRLFRLDRLEQVQFLSETFTKDPSFDPQVYMLNYCKTEQYEINVEVEFKDTLAEVEYKIPAPYGTLTSTESGVLFQTQAASLDSMARYLMTLNLPFVIHQPPQLRQTLVELAEQILQIANATA